jgi:hypothetical protein
MAIQKSLNSTIDGQGMQCGIGIGVNAQVKIIRMNAMNGYGRTKKSYTTSVCECVHVYMRREREKRNDDEYESFPRQIPETAQNSPETSARLRRTTVNTNQIPTCRFETAEENQ